MNISRSIADSLSGVIAVTHVQSSDSKFKAVSDIIRRGCGQNLRRF